MNHRSHYTAAKNAQSSVSYDTFCQMAVCKVALLHEWRTRVCAGLSIAPTLEAQLVKQIGEADLHERVWELAAEWGIDPYMLTVDSYTVRGIDLQPTLNLISLSNPSR